MLLQNAQTCLISSHRYPDKIHHAHCRFEDRAALDGGEEGMSVIDQILVLAPRLLTDKG